MVLASILIPTNFLATRVGTSVDYDRAQTLSQLNLLFNNAVAIKFNLKCLHFVRDTRQIISPGANIGVRQKGF